MLKFDESFFEDEVREGFLVESKMKRAWAAEMEVLVEIDRVCREYGLQYFADSGTLLGAIRHKGYIPWDDDIDIVMKREDYQRFLQVAPEELPEGWVVNNVFLPGGENWDRFFTKVENGKRMNFSKRHMEQFHGFPYVAGVDIFPLDKLPKEKEEGDTIYSLIKIAYSAIYLLSMEQSDKAEERIREVEELCNVQIDRTGNLQNQLFRLIENLSCLYRDMETDELVLFGWWAYRDRKYSFKKECYEECIYVPFENIEIPIPVGYTEVLRTLYGEDYMIPKTIKASHDYPFYKMADTYAKRMKNTIVFAVYYDDERYLEECLYYIKKVQIPKGITVEILTVKGKTQFAECYQEVEGKSEARYKVYLDQHTLIINDMFLYELLDAFKQNPEMDVIGILGGNETDDMRCGRLLLWDEQGVEELNRQKDTKVVYVREVNRMLVAVDHSVKRRQTKELAYEYAMLPYQKNIWCMYDCGDQSLSAESERYRFLLRRVEIYHDVQALEEIEKLLEDGKLDYKEHVACVESEALAKGSVAAYYWEDSILTNKKREKYLPANGRACVEDKTQNVMHVVAAFNHKYVGYAAVMLQSLYENNPLCQIQVHILQNELTDDDKFRLKKQAQSFENSIAFYNIDESMLPEDVKITEEWSIEAYFRLFMADVLPEEVERILYLDVDVIVNKPIHDYYFMDMNGYDIVGCRDFSQVLQEGFTDKRKELFASMKDEKDFVYINSGVMLMNLASLREKVTCRDYLRVITEQKGRLLAPDQDVINLVHWKQIGLVDEYRYDFFNACLKGVKVEEVKQYVSIIHYAGPKPWSVENINMHAHKIWWEYAVRTEIASDFLMKKV